MLICANNHTPIVYIDNGGSCPLCTEILATKLAEGERDFLINQLKKAEEICQMKS
jgi:hypothetical protein